MKNVMTDTQKYVVYIAGPMTGEPDLGRKKFYDTEQKLREEDGISVINPATLPIDMPPERYMPICLAMVREADAVFVLKNWENSEGTRMEIDYAKKLHKAIVFDD